MIAENAAKSCNLDGGNRRTDIVLPFTTGRRCPLTEKRKTASQARQSLVRDLPRIYLICNAENEEDQTIKGVEAR